MLGEQTYTVMILDLKLGTLGGEEVIQRAKALQPELIIIILTGNPSLESAITAVRSNVQEYLIKPTSMRRIITAVNNALENRRKRRLEFELAVCEALDQVQIRENSLQDQIFSGVTPTTQAVLLVAPLQLYRTQQIAKLLTDPVHFIHLTKGECDVLYWLMINHDHPVSCRHLVSLCWQYDLEKEEAASIIRPYISRLRQKLEKLSLQPQLIRTIRKRGYLFQSAE